VTTRREFVQQGAASMLVAALPLSLIPRCTEAARGFVDITRVPDMVTARTSSGDQPLRRTPGSTRQWDGAGLSVRTVSTSGDSLHVELSAPAAAVSRVGLRWRGRLDTTRLLVGDAWERGYGDFEWRGFVPDRVMPWYVMASDAVRTNGYGVRTGANAFCSWQLDPAGITLWADVRSGGAALQLGTRVLAVCDVTCRAGRTGESAFAAEHAFCRQMCPAPRLPGNPVYGSNDWYWMYGKNTAATVTADAEHIVELSPGGGNRPFVVIDDGWQPGRGADKAGAGTWDRGNDKFPDLPGLVAGIEHIGGRAGIWIRPLEAAADVPDSWRLSRDRTVLDPTRPDVRAKIAADIGRLRHWGMGLIKHDYTTYDLFGRWGNQMGSALTRDGWTFAEGPVRTTAEVINELYRTIREAANGALIIGCNTVSHLSAGQFEICRIGDDTSGREWARTRKMGVNSLAFRGAQHGAFYTADADCVGVTNAVPWELNRQWLDLLARSGTMLFVSLAPDALGADQRRDLRAALALAARPQPLGEPLDWQHNVQPARWRLMGAEHSYGWGDPDGIAQ
jgi:alpha-galactosidase